jgi:hypothetical protein
VRRYKYRPHYCARPTLHLENDVLPKGAHELQRQIAAASYFCPVIASATNAVREAAGIPQQ